MTCRRASTFLCFFVIAASLAACQLPPFELVASGPPNEVAPSGPKVSALLENLKCELETARHDQTSIPIKVGGKDAEFKLIDRLSDIGYVASVQYTLQVTDTEALNPSINKIFPFAKAATNFTLSVGGTLSEAADRDVVLNTTVDLTNLDQPPEKGCDHGSELGGNMGLAEILAMGLISASANDVAVTPGRLTDSNDDASVGIATPDNFNYLYGVFGTLTDFTITENVNGGPNWTLTHFTGPTPSQGLLSFNRVVKDQINISFAPWCVRTKYTDSEHAPPGYPHWAFAIGTKCPANKKESAHATIKQPTDARLRALGAGGANNFIQNLQHLLPRLTQ
jgi:hypothetical protein